MKRGEPITTISVKPETKAELQRFKVHRRQTDDEVINLLIKGRQEAMLKLRDQAEKVSVARAIQSHKPQLASAMC